MKQIFSDRVPSDEFMRIVTHTGSAIIECEFCGRVHFSPLATGLDEEDVQYLKELEAKSEKDPDAFVIVTDADSIAWGHIDGKQAVWGCPCNAVRKYEDFVWGHRWLIADYLKMRAARMQEEADRHTERLGDLNLEGT